MPRLSELFEDAVGPVEPSFDTHALQQRLTARRRRRRARRLVALALTAGLGVGAVLVLAVRQTPRNVVTAAPPRGVFAARTDTVLAFDDGIDGVALVDLDRRRAVRRVVQGQRAGDQSFRLTRTADALIVGWGEIYAAPLDGGPSRLLGTATEPVPATEPGTVWLIDYPEGNAAGGTYRLVDLDGNVLQAASGDSAELSPADPVHAIAAVGVRDGLAFESNAGLRVWNTQTGQISVLGSGPGEVGDAHDNLLAWCDDCQDLHITDLTGDDQVISSPRSVEVFDVRSARFSANGRYLAVVAGPRITRGSDTAGVLVLVDVRDGTRRVIARHIAMYDSYLGWTSDSEQLFFSTYSYVQASNRIGRIDLGTSRVERATLPFGGALSFVALERSEARQLLQATDGPKTACRPPTGQPTNRSVPCSFKFSPHRG